MKRRKKRRLRSARVNKRVLINNQRTVILTALFMCGLLLGSVSVKNADTEILEKIKELTESFILQKSSQSILQNFAASAGTDTLFILLSVMFGLCIIGEPVLWLLPLVRGLGIGLSSGYIYKTYNLQGVMYCLAIIFIPAMLSVAATIISCKESIITSKEIFNTLKENKPLNKPDYFKLFIIRNLILYGLMLFSSGLGSALTYFFASDIIHLS